MGRAGDGADYEGMTDATNAHDGPQDLRRFQRSREHRLLAGIAGGLGEQFGLNPWLFRLGFVVLTFFGFAGVVLYIVGWLLMPDTDEDDSILVRWLSRLELHDPVAIGGVVLVGLAALIWLTDAPGIGQIMPGRYPLAALLLIVGVLMYRGDLRSRRPGPADGPATPEGDGPPPVGPTTEDPFIAGSIDMEESPSTESPPPVEPPAALEIPAEGALTSSTETAHAVASDQDFPADSDFSGGLQPPPADVSRPTELARHHRKARQSSFLGRATLALGFLAVGALAVADVGEWLFPEPVHYLALMLAVAAVGLLAGAVVGRARWLIVIGVLLTPAVLVASVISAIDLSAFEFGDRLVIPVGDDVESEYRLAAGSLTVDLREVDLSPSEEISIDIQVGAGELVVIVPAGAGLVIDAAVGAGVVDLLGTERDGIGVSEEMVLEGSGTFVIDAQTVFGTVQIIQR